jgi:hypothetical protein
MTGNAEKQGFDATRFEIAPTEVVDGYEQELYRLLVVIAETSKPDDPKAALRSIGCRTSRWFGILIAFWTPAKRIWMY